MENTLVWCKTKAQLLAVLTEAKKRGYVVDSPTRMTDNFWSNYHEETVVNLNGNGRSITYCYKDWYIEHPNFGKIISADKFLVTRPILITRKGRIITAEDKNTGEKAIATCSPDDTFNFGTGAAIALARLMAKTPEALTDDVKTEWKKVLGIKEVEAYTDDDRNFKVGDLVTLREGVKKGDHFGHLDVEYGAMFDQGYHKPIKVIEISKAGSYLCVPAEGNGTDFYYHEEMLEPWDESKIREGDIVKVINTGLNYSTYPQWVGKHISDPDMAARYCYSSPNTERKYKVLKIAEHEFNGRMLAFIEECNGIGHNRCYLIEVKGLEKVTE